MGLPDERGCCAGITADTPDVKFNRPGLPAVAYRVGAFADFRASLLARLSSTDFPALAQLGTRRADDWTIGACDAFAVLADVLTFYQERIANESWLRTATERRSVLELARLIGYQLAPGVAAGTWLAFTLESAPGQPALAAQPVVVPVGTRAQSVPDPDQKPQSFETTAEITARVEWNALAVQASAPLAITPGLSELCLQGTATQLQPGDALLLVGGEREDGTDPTSSRWEVCWVTRVSADTKAGITRVRLDHALGSVWSTSSQHGVHVHALRQRAALFGQTAVDPGMLLNPPVALGAPDWTNKSINSTKKRIDLDGTYPKIVAGGWVVLIGRDPDAAQALSGEIVLFRIQKVVQGGRVVYGMSGKCTQVLADIPDGFDESPFPLRTTFILAQSEELRFASRPLGYPLYGAALALDGVAHDLVPDQVLAVSGRRARIGLLADVSGVSFPADPARKAVPRESFRMAAAPETLGTPPDAVAADDLQPAIAQVLAWHVLDHDGAELLLHASTARVELQAALDDDEVVSEVVTIAHATSSVVVDAEAGLTHLALTASLAQCYDRATAAVNANVAPATHGESVSEIAGSGDAAASSQRFVLKQPPLTWVSDASQPTGRASTLELRVNDLLWHAVPSLYGRGPLERVYTLRQQDDATTAAAFGDGVQGARLPTGQNNVRAAYRKGIGAGGNLRAGQISNLVTRPLGVKAAVNPVAASGGQDAETLDAARRSAPLRVLTLDRAVSLADYADFARSFAGIEKACAVWIDDASARGVYVTVAGAGGDAVPEDGETHANLVDALRRYGDPLLPLSVRTYASRHVHIEALVKPDPDAVADAVLAAVAAALRTAFAFDARDFGQTVALDEVYAVIQGVPGVIAADVKQLHDAGLAPGVLPEPRVFARLPTLQADGSVDAAEILTLEDGPLNLAVMT